MAGCCGYGREHQSGAHTNQPGKNVPDHKTDWTVADISIQMLESDPVNALDVVQTIRHHLQKVQAENGGPEAFQNTWVVNVDQEVLGDFSKLQII